MGKLLKLTSADDCDPFEEDLEILALYLGRRFGYEPARAFEVGKQIKKLPMSFRPLFEKFWSGRQSEMPLYVGGRIYRITELQEQCANFVEAFLYVHEASRILPPREERDEW